MIIDDDLDMGDLAAQTIRNADHALVVTDVVQSGQEAMDKLGDVDVVVVDFRMPYRNGLEVAADILAAMPGKNIVLFSAYFDNQTLQQAKQIGIRECVLKDAFRELPAVIRRCCPPN